MSALPLLTLAALKAGDRVRISRIVELDASVQRLMVMGLVEGAEVAFVRSSLGGDPLEFRVHGAAISLRREQARHFQVTRISEHG
jgi:ferrous iron transport protein A